MESQSHETFRNRSEDYYERLVAGKALELKVIVAIMHYAFERTKIHTLKPARIRLYEPLLDIDAIDLVVRTETEHRVDLEEIQVKTTRNGLQVTESMLDMSKKYRSRSQEFIILCCREPEALKTLKDTRCFMGSDIFDLMGDGKHISASKIEECESYEWFIEAKIDAVERPGKLRRQ